MQVTHCVTMDEKTIPLFMTRGTFEQVSQKCVGCNRWLMGDEDTEVTAMLTYHVECGFVVRVSMPFTVTWGTHAAQERGNRVARALKCSPQKLDVFDTQELCGGCEVVTHVNCAHACFRCWSLYLFDKQGKERDLEPDSTHQR
jgi:hypothetical protein